MHPDDPRLFFTGASGALAPFLIHRFLHDGLQGGVTPRFICLIRQQGGAERVRRRIEAICPACARRVGPKRFEFVLGDVTTDFSYSGHVDAVWHFAGDLRMDPESAEQVEESNLAGARRILDFCGKKRAPLYYLSTAYVCGTRTGTVLEDELDCGQAFRNAYESSKARAESLVREWLRDNDGIIFRPSIVLGDTATGVVLSFNGMYRLMNWARCFQESMLPKLGLSAADLSRLTLRPPIPVAAPPARTFINVVGAEYITSLLVRIHRLPAALGKTFHLANPDPPSAEALLRHCCRLLGVGAIEVAAPGSPAPEELSEATGRLNRMLGNQIMVYWPYLVGGHPHFDMRNVRKICGKIPEHPKLDEAAWDRMYQYAVGQDFVSI